MAKEHCPDAEVRMETQSMASYQRARQDRQPLPSNCANSQQLKRLSGSQMENFCISKPTRSQLGGYTELHLQYLLLKID